MATLRDIKRRITSITSTAKITSAMKMVSAAKLRRAQERMLAMRPYSDKMLDVLASLAQAGEMDIHPLMKLRPRKTVEVLIITSDKGLCGAFNANVIKSGVNFINRLESEGFDVSISVIGKKAEDHFKRREVPLRKSWTRLSGSISFTTVKEIADNMIDSYLDESADEVYIVYNEFRTVVAQEIRHLKLLPVSDIESSETPETALSETKGYLFEPSEKDIYSKLLPRNVEVQVFRAILESRASEEAARMTAMENATRSANDMIERLTLEYNKARQASITTELMDIVGGAEALKG